MAEACLSGYLYLTAEKAQPGARGRPTAYEKFSIPPPMHAGKSTAARATPRTPRVFWVASHYSGVVADRFSSVPEAHSPPGGAPTMVNGPAAQRREPHTWPGRPQTAAVGSQLAEQPGLPPPDGSASTGATRSPLAGGLACDLSETG